MIFSKGKEFFELLDRVAKNVLDGALALDRFISDSMTEANVRELKEIEHVGDNLTHATIELLNKTFITPLDREDIHHLVTSMDDILDYIYGSADRLNLYKIHTVSEEMKALAKILTRSVEEVSKAVLRLKDFKNPEMILAQCIEVNRLENEADNAHRKGVAALFEKERDPIQIIKMKEIFDHMETATDRCEDVANVIEGIVVKNA